MADGKIDIELEVKDSKAQSQGKKAGDQIAKGVEQGIKNVGKSADTAAKQTEKSFQSAANSAKSSFSDVGSAAKNSFSDVGDAAKNASSDASSAFEEIPADAEGAFSDVGSEAQSGFDGVADAAQSASGDAASAFQEIPADAEGAFSDVGDAAKSGFDSVPDAANSAAGDAAGAFGQITDAAEAAGDSVSDSLGVKTIAAGNLAADAITAAAGKIVELGKNAINSGMDFDKSMSQVAATMGITTDEIGELTEFAKHMGETTAFSAAQSADALNYMALAGYDAETSMKMLPTVLNLAAAGNMDLATASDMVTDAQSALGLSLDETSEMVDKMAKASSKSNTSVEQLGNAFLTVGGTAKNLKNGTTEAATALGILADNGIKGSEGGTALRNVILSLSAPTDKAAGSLQELGIQVFDAEGNMRGLDDIFRQFDDSMKSLSQKEKTEALNNIFNKVDLKSVTALMANANGEISNMGKALEDTGFDFEHVASKSMTEFGTATGGATDMAILIQEAMNELGDDVESVSEIIADDFNISIDDARSLVQTAAGEVGKSGDRFDELAGYIDNAAGSAQKMADTQLDNLAGDVTLLESATEGFYIAVSDALTPALRGLTQFGTNTLLPFLTNGVKNFDKLAPAVIAATIAIVAMVTKSKTAKTLTSIYEGIARSVGKTTTEFKAMSVAEKAGAVSTKALGTAMNALKTAAPVLIFTALVEVATLLIGKFNKARERTEKFNTATSGLEKAASGVAVAIDEETGAFDSLGSAIDDIDVDDLINKHVELAKTISDTSSETASSVALLGDYGNAIEDLADRSDLSEQEVAKLKIAVDQVNQSLGTSYEVVQDADGIYRIMADGVEVAKDEVLKLIDAQKLQMQLEAEMKNYEAVYAQLQEDNEKLAQAKKNVQEATEKLRQAEADYYSSDPSKAPEEVKAAYDSAKSELEKYENELSAVEGVQGSAQSSANKLTERVTLLKMATDESASAFVKAAAENMNYSSGVQAMNVDLVGFTKALEDMGYTADDVASMSQEDAMQMAKAWQDGYDLTKKSTDATVKDVLDTLDKMGDGAYDSAHEAGEQGGKGWADGLSSETKAAVDAALKVTGLTIDEFKAAADEAGVEGDDAVKQFAASIAAGSKQSKDAGEKNSTAANKGFASANTKQTGIGESKDFYTGVGSNVTNSKNAGTSHSNAANAGMKTADTRSTGVKKGQDFYTGVGANIEQSKSAGTSHSNAANTGMASADTRSTGAKKGQDFATGVGSKTGEARSAGVSDANAAKSGLQSQSDNASSWGSHLGQNFADGLRRALSAVRNAALDLVDAAASLLRHSVPKEGPLREGGRGEAVWGEHMVLNFAAGMTSRKSISAIRSASKQVAVDINDSLKREMMAVDPMAQLEESLAKGSAAFNMSAMMVGAAPTYTNNNQTVNFNGDIQSPDIIARNMRLQQYYGLAGRY